MGNPTIFIVSDRGGRRLNYVLDIVFDIHLGTNYQLVRQEAEVPSGAPVIHYGQSSEDVDGISIYRHPIMDEDNVYAQHIRIDRDTEGRPFFFASFDFHGEYLFDLFALIFYMLTRYEEYLRFVPDKYGRFSGKSSLVYREDFVQIPIVDIWIMNLKKQIESKWNIHLKLPREFKIKPTIDIDTPYAFLAKPWWLQAGVIVRDIALGRGARLKNRLATLLGMKMDCFDTYGYLADRMRHHGLETIYFVLMRLELPDDQNFSVHTRKFKSLVKSLRTYAKCGLHPSLSSSSDCKKCLKEKEQLENLTRTEIYLSRQHFLCLSFPSTYRSLLEIGITDDYSMGFHDVNGFRAGTSVAFPWYDLKLERQTNLIVHPFQIMDVTLQKYEEKTVEEAMESVQELMGSVKKVNGTFSFIWHNSSFAPEYGWQGWSEVFESCLTLKNMNSTN